MGNNGELGKMCSIEFEIHFTVDIHHCNIILFQIPKMELLK